MGVTGITEEFEADNESVWSANLPYLRNRLKVEIFNLALGVAKGDEAAAASDPRAAVAALEKL